MMGQVINAFWTLLCFLPVAAMWLRYGSQNQLWIIIGLSFAALAIPSRWLLLSKDPTFYQQLGVRFIRKFVQNGDGYKRKKIIHDAASAISYMSTIRMYERFHFFCLIFFFMSTIDGLIYSQYLTAALIVVANVIYNVCPLFLQQYNYVRLIRFEQLNKFR
jgi:hypothetical protein